ncbi:hypothetical protein [Bacteroides acidifaciens]|uniref:hypothetical protein n=1 Tax=Bacteroides acidifaciens TaxID=85831 RepID=UPI0025A94D26|nr:hypothetical protein [Bacteroides acidifaciens]
MNDSLKSGKARTPGVEGLYSPVFLTSALFGYADADTRNRFSHGRVEKGERHTLTENMERSFMPY